MEKDHAERLLNEAVKSIQQDECLTCDCFVGFIVQLELDCEEDISSLTEKYKIKKEDMHGCLGCNPCPPAEIYAKYKRRCNCGNDQECS